MFDETRATARYAYTAYPALPDILKKPSKKDPDQIWEARPNFHHPGYSLQAPGDITVTALDANAAYLSALKAWLPIGKLEHSTGSDGVDPKRSGVHLITPAAWDAPAPARPDRRPRRARRAVGHQRHPAPAASASPARSTA